MLLESTGKPDRVAVYCRVSSDEQVHSGTIQNQTDFARRYCELHQLAIAETYTDEGVSGTVDPTQRPGAMQMLAGAKAGRFNVLLVYRLDRLSRKLWHLLATHQGFEQCGVAIRSMTEPLDTSTPVGRFVFQLLGSIAELERETIRQRSELGMERALNEGRPPGATPLGFMRDQTGRFVPHSLEAPLVKEVFALAASGASAGGIARLLNERNVSPVWVDRGYTSTNDKPKAWSHSVICQILKNPVYWTGNYRHERKKDGAIFDVEVVSLVERAVAVRANQQLAQNNVNVKGTHRVYLLTGLIRCGECGSAWVGSGASARNRIYYRCQSWRQKKEERTCQAGQVRADLLDARIWADIKVIAQNPGNLAARVADKLSESAEEVEAARRELEVVMQEYDRVAQERFTAMRAADGGEITREELSHYLRAGSGRMHELERLRNELAEKLASRQMDEARIASTEEVCLRLRDLVAEAEGNPVLQRELTRAMVRRVTMEIGPDGKPEAVVEYLVAELPQTADYTSDGIIPASPELKS